MRPEGPKIEAESREWGGILGEGQQAPPARGHGGALTSQRVFFTIFSTQDGLS